MAIFPHLILEPTVQENDKTRLDASKSFITSDEAAITLVEIEPEASVGFIDVTGSGASSWYLDYQYTTEEDKTVTVRITTDGSPVTQTGTVSVVSASTDKLFSTDSDLVIHEPDILDYVRAGRNSFLDVHRRSQARILDWLDSKKITDVNGDRLTKAAIVDIEEVRNWSTYMTLRFIFEGLSNAVEDVFDQKARKYGELEAIARNRGVLRFDRDGDGTIDDDEHFEFRTKRLVRF